MPPAGSAPERGDDLQLLLSIGGVVGHVVLERPAPAFRAAVEDRFSEFALPNSRHVNRAFSLRLRCAPAPAGSTPAGAAEGGGKDPAAATLGSALRVDVAGDAVTITRADFAAALGRPLPSAGPSEGRGHTWETVSAFESLLRILWSIYLPRAGGVLLHACGLQVGGRGVAAPAGSGVGKTTLARKAGAAALSDEIVVVHRGADRRWRLSATPFFGEQAVARPSMRSHPLLAVAFLEQAPAVEARRLGVTDAVKRALACLICFEGGTGAATRNLGIAIELCQEVPAVVCASTEATPWAAILTALAPHLAPAPPFGASPDNVRELVADLRNNLRRHGRYAFAPRGGSMRPFVRSGDTVFVESVSEAAVRAGDVLLYWRAGATADADTLTCHRMIGRVPGSDGAVFLTKGDSLPHVEAFQTAGSDPSGTRAELLGRVRAISRAGQANAWSVPGRLGSLGIVMASLVTAGLFPLTRLVPRK